MRFLFLSTTFPDAKAMTRGTYNFALCRALVQQQHEVRVIAPRPWPEVLQARLHGKSFHTGSAVDEAGLKTVYPCYWYWPKIRQHRSGQRMWQSLKSAVLEQCQEFKPDVVLSYWAHPDGEAGLRAARHLGAKAAVIVGGSDVLLLPHNRKRGIAVRRVLNESDAVLSVSEGLRKATIALGVDPHRVHTVYQGIDETVFHPGDQIEARKKLGLPVDQKIAIWVGRMVPVKGLDQLLAAFKRIQSSLPVKLYLLGDGPLKRELEQLAKAEGVDNVVQFVGPVGHDRIADWYRAADLAVMSSLSEGLPNVLRESLACGTPFVSTDVGSLKEIADPVFSRLTPPGDVNSLAKGVLDVCRDDRYRLAAQQAHVRTWTESAQETVRIISSPNNTPEFRG